MILPKNIGSCWKGLPGTNALAYSASFSAIKKKSFIALTPAFFCCQSNYWEVMYWRLKWVSVKRNISYSFRLN